MTSEAQRPRANRRLNARRRSKAPAVALSAAGAASVAAPSPVRDQGQIAAPPTLSQAQHDSDAWYAEQRAAQRPPRGRGRRRLGALGLLLMLGLLVSDFAVFKPWQGAGALPGRSPSPLPLAEFSPIGANMFMNKEVDNFKKDKTMALAQDAGLDWIKQQFPWPEIEISGPGNYYDDKNGKVSWLKFDDIVQRVNASGMRLIARIDRAPAWARPGQPDSAPPTNPQDFANFVTAFVTRYKGKVQAIQIWNEPNLEDEWYGAGKGVDPAGYAALLKAAFVAAKKVDPNIIVLSAPLAVTNDEAGNLRETIYMDRMYQAFDKLYKGAGDCRYCFDVVAANGFGLDAAPEDPPSPQVLNFRRVELLHDVMLQHGESNKPVWFTEYGWNAAPTTLSQEQQDRWRRVSQSEQADYTVRGIAYARANWPWAGVFTLWYFRQVGDIPASDAEYYFSMVTPEFVPEPVYYALDKLAAQLRVAGPGAYGPFSAPVKSDQNWTLQLQQGDNDAETPLLVSSGANATASLSFEGTDVDLSLTSLGQSDNNQPARVFVTVDGGVEGVAAELPRDQAGLPFIDSAVVAARESGAGGKLAAPASATTTLALVRGLDRAYAPQVHQLQLRATGAGATIAGFSVRGERSLAEFWLVTALLLLGLLGDILLLRKWRAG